MDYDMCQEHDEVLRFDGADFELVDPDEEELDEAEANWGYESDELPSSLWARQTE